MSSIHPTTDSQPIVDAITVEAMSGSNSAAYEHTGTVDKWRKDYYSPNATRYYDEAVAKAARLMQLQPGARVLDAGCGTGVHAIRLCQMGAKVCAVDISSTMLDEARLNAAAAGLTANIEFNQVNIAESGLPSAQFDHVFSWGVLIHIPDFEVALDNLIKTLKPGGTLALYLTNESALDLTLERVARKLSGKPVKHYVKNQWGSGFWHDMPGGKMWTNHIRAAALISHMQTNHCQLIHHGAGELTELQKYARGRVRRFMQSMNYWMFRLQYPVCWGATQLLVFRKAGDDRAGTLAVGTK